MYVYVMCPVSTNEISIYIVKPHYHHEYSSSTPKEIIVMRDESWTCRIPDMQRNLLSQTSKHKQVTRGSFILHVCLLYLT